VRLEHTEEVVGELDLSRELVVAGATHVGKRALDLSSQEARQDHVGIVAELRGVDVTFVCNALEGPGEPTRDNFLIESVGKPADRGHLAGCYRTAARVGDRVEARSSRDRCRRLPTGTR
jgi:hypothetical protein